MRTLSLYFLLIATATAGNKPAPRASPVVREPRWTIEAICKVAPAVFVGTTGTNLTDGFKGRLGWYFRYTKPTEHGFTLYVTVLAYPNDEELFCAYWSAYNEAETFYHPPETTKPVYPDIKPLPTPTPTPSFY